jgi:hypothetical protein
MVVAATRPVVKLAEGMRALVARAIPGRKGVAFYLAALSVGPLVGRW